MKYNEAFEIRTRLLLWSTTLWECKRQLELAARADAANTPEKMELQQERMRGLQDLGPRNAPPEPGDPDGLNKYQRFNADHPEYYAFPTTHDLRYAVENALMLAIIMFCRIWNRGDAAPGYAKSNQDAVMAGYREKMVASAFPDPTERAKFDAFLKVLLNDSNKMLAHSDAARSRMQDPDGVLLSPQVAYELDRLFLAECVERLSATCRVFEPFDEVDATPLAPDSQ